MREAFLAQGHYQVNNNDLVELTCQSTQNVTSGNTCLKKACLIFARAIRFWESVFFFVARILMFR